MWQKSVRQKLFCIFKRKKKKTPKNPGNEMKSLLNQFTGLVQKGDSWILIIILFVVSAIICWAMCCKPSIFSDWAYEPILEVPKKYRNLPIVKTFFEVSRGCHYSTKLYGTHSVSDVMNRPTEPVKKDLLFSGWAFIHCFQHFLIAFLCPKLAWVSFIYGVTWELIESSGSGHDTLDIFWNMCGCLLGLLTRAILYPDGFRTSK